MTSKSHLAGVGAEPGSALKNPILHIAAAFWEADRLEAFRTCYNSMRYIDDLVDNRKSSGALESLEMKTRTLLEIRSWTDNPGGTDPGSDSTEFNETMKNFRIPREPWIRLARAMEFDVTNERFETMFEFLRYTRGAAVAPATVFLHLISLTKKDGEYHTGRQKIRRVARPLAVFSYMVHILRDFRIDFDSKLDYFPRDLKHRFQVTPQVLASAAEGNQSAEFNLMIHEYCRIASKYYRRAVSEVEKFSSGLEPRYRFSLGLIRGLYEAIYRRFEPGAFVLNPSRINLEPSDIIAVIRQIEGELSPGREIFEEGMERLGMSAELERTSP